MLWKQVHVPPVHVSDEQWGLLQALSSATVSLTDEQHSGSVFRTASGQESIVHVRAGSAKVFWSSSLAWDYIQVSNRFYSVIYFNLEI